LDRAATWIGS